MIPKIIHYCWFGGNPLNEKSKKCIESWKRFLPDFEIKEWNESNFDINITQFTKDAYADNNYAFVSDYVRFWAIYHFGGLYFDTDVELIKPIDDIIEKGAFMSCEIFPIKTGDYNNPDLGPWVNPGQGIGAPPSHPIYAELLEVYKTVPYKYPEGSVKRQVTIVTHTTELLFRHGLKNKNGIQVVDGISIYPKDYANPLDDFTGKLTITENTRSIHWYAKSWTGMNPIRIKLSRIVHRILGEKYSSIIVNPIKKIFG